MIIKERVKYNKYFNTFSDKIDCDEIDHNIIIMFKIRQVNLKSVNNIFLNKRFINTAINSRI